MWRNEGCQHHQEGKEQFGVPQSFKALGKLENSYIRMWEPAVVEGPKAELMWGETHDGGLFVHGGGESLKGGSHFENAT